MKRSRFLFPIVGLLFVFAGCSPRLEDEKTVDLTPEKVQKYSTPSPLKTLTVTFESDKEPVSVYVCDSGNEVRDTEALSKKESPTFTFDKKEKEKSGTIQINLNDKRRMTVYVVCDGPTRVKVKMSGR